MTGAAEKLIETNPPFGVLASLWWSFTWRAILWYIALVIILIIFGIALGFMIVAVGGGEGVGQMLGQVAGFIFGVVGGFWVYLKVMRSILGKTYGGYRLVFLTPAASGYDEPASRDKPAEPPKERLSETSHPDSV